MKKYFFTCFITLTSLILFAGNTSNTKNDSEEKPATTLVSGKVIDKISGEEIAGAEIRIDNKIVYSDLDGKFTASIDVNNTEAVIKYISYNDTKVKINPYTYNTITIELASR